jgi:phospholipase/carboxylesterase
MRRSPWSTTPFATVLVAALAALSSRAASAQLAPAPAAAPADTFHGVYFAERTTAGASATERLPLVILLHGLGGIPGDFADVFADLPVPARLAAARGLDRFGGGYGWLAMPVPRDLNLRAPSIRRAVAALEPAITALAQARATCGAPVVVGFSQGAMVAYGLLASAHPVVAAAVPISGYLPPIMVPRRAPSPAPSVTAFHGARDRVAPLDADRVGVAGLRAAGYTATLRTYPGVGHELTPAMRADARDALIDALRRGGCTPAGAPSAPR